TTQATAGLVRTRVEFDCWGATYADASNLRAALIAALNGYQGALANGIQVQNVVRVQSVDFYHNEAMQFRLTADFVFYYD
ncbi:MAG: hypothetical protein ACP5FH_12510, partial [Terracidiphilus sp.]